MNVKDIISGVVDRMNETLSNPIGFHHGHPLEIVNTFKLATHSEDKSLMFPALCLFHDIPERIGIEHEVTINVVIITDTQPAFTAAERYTNSFDPILTPLYDLFIQKMAESDYVSSTLDRVDEFDHQKIDRLFWGKQGLYGSQANIFNDYIDAIEIIDLKFEILNTC